MRNRREDMINFVTRNRRKWMIRRQTKMACCQVAVVNRYRLVTCRAAGGECLSKDLVERQSRGNAVNPSCSIIETRWSSNRKERDGMAGKGCWRKRMLPCNGVDRATGIVEIPEPKGCRLSAGLLGREGLGSLESLGMLNDGSKGH